MFVQLLSTVFAAGALVYLMGAMVAFLVSVDRDLKHKHPLWEISAGMLMISVQSAALLAIGVDDGFLPRPDFETTALTTIDILVAVAATALVARLSLVRPAPHPPTV